MICPTCKQSIACPACAADLPNTIPVREPAMGNHISPMKPLTEEQVFASEWIMAANAGIGLGMQEIMVFVRAIERARGIGITGGGK